MDAAGYGGQSADDRDRSRCSGAGTAEGGSKVVEASQQGDDTAEADGRGKEGRFDTRYGLGRDEGNGQASATQHDPTQQPSDQSCG